MKEKRCSPSHPSPAVGWSSHPVPALRPAARRGPLCGWLPAAACCVGLFAGGLSALHADPVTPAQWRQRVLEVTGVPRGLVVVLGDAGERIGQGLIEGTGYQLYTQRVSVGEVRAAREAAHAAGWLGRRMTVGEGPVDRLNLADNLADAVLVLAAPAPPAAELQRVLRPGGRAWLPDGTVLGKSRPDGEDDWTHPYHGPDNNPVSEDRVIAAPYLTQFLADPRYAPLPQVAVAAGGRMFKAFGHIAFKEREEGLLNTLAAFNGYNGTLLWQREIPPALMVHRNTLIATAERVFFGDDRSCQIYAAATGEPLDEIRVPDGVAEGTFWKWMALEDGVLFALVGEQEQRDPTIRLRRDLHGWPWSPLSPGFNQPEHVWGYGRTLVAIDVASKQVRWAHREERPIDSRALCLKAGRLYAFRFGEYLVALEAATGRELWRRTPDNAPDLYRAFGPYLDRQDWRTNWRTTAYARCTDQAIYFAGPAIGRLIAVSTRDGALLWDHPSDNYQLIVRRDAVYGLSGQIDSDVSRVFDPLTGEVLDELKLGRRACTRPTACDEAIFFRASGGSVRLDVKNDEAGLISPMRAQCQDGVTIANGMLYWWPSVCDCNLTLYGVTALGAAGSFDFQPSGGPADRLQTTGRGTLEKPLVTAENDWPVYRGNARGTVTSAAALPAGGSVAWRVQLGEGVRPTAPTAAGGLVFFGGSDGVVRSCRADNGEAVWTAFTGGPVLYPPAISAGCAYVGSGDGHVYCYEAASGRLRWRFRAAPIERFIPVYGQLQSTWPAAGGVAIHDGTVYAAAGIVNYDGTHVVALDAGTGEVRWENNQSGHLDPEARSGVSVQGHLMLEGDRLYLPGGNAVSPAVYDLATGRCLSDPGLLRQTINNNVPASVCPRGSELYFIEGDVHVSDKPLYAHPDYPVQDDSVLRKTLVASTSGRDLLWVNNEQVLCYERIESDRSERLRATWGKPKVPGADPVWAQPCAGSRAFAAGRNAVAVAVDGAVQAFALADGRPLWRVDTRGSAVPWGMAVDRDGRVLVSLEGGEVMGIAGGGAALARR
ncbi:MAG: PQQ-binding-like beta-propeller repeat protein [Verrucomicrobiales bacterium]|nr:PQQ-binding-like beta-propeller repeat protein [Verrucomicrobiales bacterium]MCP5526219.1 PQQ-binding-like beta-propeller repeat protein [Verrucomicrobiales bacterium]